MSSLVRYLAVPEGDDGVPHKIRVNAAGQISVIDVITNIYCLGDDNQPTPAARQSSLSYYNRLTKEYEEVKSLSLHFKFPGQGQRETLVWCYCTYTNAKDTCHWTFWNVAYYTATERKEGSKI